MLDVAMLESAVNPYEPPKVDLYPEDIEVTESEAYRDGEDLLVPVDYEGPKVCFITGVELSKSSIAKKAPIGVPFVMARPMLKWLHLLLCILLIGVMTLGDGWMLWTGGVGAIYLFVFIKLNKKIKLHYELKVHKSKTRLAAIMMNLINLPLILFVTFQSEHFSLADDYAYLIIGIVLFCLGQALVAKKFSIYQVQGFDNGLVRIRGAHPNYLARFPEFEKKEEERVA